MFTTLMFVAIWMFGAGFLMSQKRSAEMFVIETLTFIIGTNKEYQCIKNLRVSILGKRGFFGFCSCCQFCTDVQFLSYTPLFIDSTESSLWSALLLGKDYSPSIIVLFVFWSGFLILFAKWLFHSSF